MKTIRFKFDRIFSLTCKLTPILKHFDPKCRTDIVSYSDEIGSFSQKCKIPVPKHFSVSDINILKFIFSINNERMQCVVPIFFFHKLLNTYFFFSQCQRSPLCHILNSMLLIRMLEYHFNFKKNNWLIHFESPK